MNEWLNKVEALCQDICKNVGCYLYEVEFGGLGQGRTLRVFIDKDAPGGADIEDCTHVSRGLNEILDAEGNDLIPGGAYQLEVSTPGIERVLRKAWHFEKVVGKKIWVKAKEAFETAGKTDDTTLQKAKQVEAVLKEFSNETLTLENKKGDLVLPLSQVEKSKVVFEMPKKQKPK